MLLDKCVLGWLRLIGLVHVVRRMGLAMLRCGRLVCCGHIVTITQGGHLCNALS
jgi:hypothetical protein